jgi:hypothetical protein
MDEGLATEPFAPCATADLTAEPISMAGLTGPGLYTIISPLQGGLSSGVRSLAHPP